MEELEYMHCSMRYKVEEEEEEDLVGEEFI